MYRLQHALTAVLLLAAMFVASACDSGVPPDELNNTTDPTVITFVGSETDVSERDTTVTVTLQVENPGDSEVSAELLYAAGASSATIEDFNIGDATPVSEDSTAYVLQTVTFPANADDGATQSFTYTLTDTEEETNAELGIFALQNVSGAEVGAGTFRINIAGEGTVRLLEARFDDEFAPMTAVSVDTESSADWEISSAGGAPNVPYAVCNGFGDGGIANDWLISPALNTVGFDSVTLSFLNAKNFNDSGQRGLNVLVSTDYDGSSDPTSSAFTWTDISNEATYSPGGYEFVESGPIDITQFEGENVYVAFQYTQTAEFNAALWEVDNIVVDADE